MQVMVPHTPLLKLARPGRERLVRSFHLEVLLRSLQCPASSSDLRPEVPYVPHSVPSRRNTTVLGKPGMPTGGADPLS